MDTVLIRTTVVMNVLGMSIVFINKRFMLCPHLFHTILLVEVAVVVGNIGTTPKINTCQKEYGDMTIEELYCFAVK